MKLGHEGIPAEMYDDCIKEWNQSLDKQGKIVNEICKDQCDFKYIIKNIIKSCTLN